jgi:hypothetical protein
MECNTQTGIYPIKTTHIDVKIIAHINSERRLVTRQEVGCPHRPLH